MITLVGPWFSGDHVRLLFAKAGILGSLIWETAVSIFFIKLKFDRCKVVLENIVTGLQKIEIRCLFLYFKFREKNDIIE